ncbi:hypothetical protein CD800_23825 [Pseudomonas aeruginosa]|nr:hypothetical protein CD800_23825 [Pseudomonas aeruginosa]
MVLLLVFILAAPLIRFLIRCCGAGLNLASNVDSVDGTPPIIVWCGRGAPVSPDNQGFALVIQ